MRFSKPNITEHYGTLRNIAGMEFHTDFLRYATTGTGINLLVGVCAMRRATTGTGIKKFEAKKAPPKRGHRLVSLFDTVEVSQYLIDALKVSLLIESGWKLILSIHEQFFG